ncbi:hypothetical protein Zmor_014592 [Zophobas morio]|uniref:Negative elongation factor E n=1 Tax=Zophobas morio TaxID=2755281 RepID=A0AA38MGK1_9CUCU|nr:hypothetical protein Zmor_014592 [Zophobas morio]
MEFLEQSPSLPVCPSIMVVPHGERTGYSEMGQRKYTDLFVGIFWKGSEEVIFKGSLTRIRPMMDSRDKSARDNGDSWGCFIVCTPSPLPNAVLKNVFSRFGNLIDVYMLNNRNCGFAKYANAESAETAIKTLHGAEICGIRMKVLKAEEKQDHNRKRQRIDDK